MDSHEFTLELTTDKTTNRYQAEKRNNDLPAVKILCSEAKHHTKQEISNSKRKERV